jgi:hypothetical protein
MHHMYTVPVKIMIFNNYISIKKLSEINSAYELYNDNRMELSNIFHHITI